MLLNLYFILLKYSQVHKLHAAGVRIDARGPDRTASAEIVHCAMQHL